MIANLRSLHFSTHWNPQTFCVVCFVSLQCDTPGSLLHNANLTIHQLISHLFTSDSPWHHLTKTMREPVSVTSFVQLQIWHCTSFSPQQQTCWERSREWTHQQISPKTNYLTSLSLHVVRCSALLTLSSLMIIRAASSGITSAEHH